jgi:hypothetical protein
MREALRRLHRSRDAMRAAWIKQDALSQPIDEDTSDRVSPFAGELRQSNQEQT